jgi:hypothetical protein
MNALTAAATHRAASRPQSSSGRIPGWLLALAIALPSVCWSASSDRDFAEKPWIEIQAQLPPFPQAENLIPFFVSAASDNKFLIDGESLVVATDGVVRYTLVIVSPSGAQTISYEGIRCATGERRIYALGRSDKTWSKARNDEWTRIKESALNRHHAELYSQYFCTVGVNIRDADDARRALRQGGHELTRQH